MNRDDLNMVPEEAINRLFDMTNTELTYKLKYISDHEPQTFAWLNSFCKQILSQMTTIHSDIFNSYPELSVTICQLIPQSFMAGFYLAEEKWKDKLLNIPMISGARHVKVEDFG